MNLILFWLATTTLLVVVVFTIRLMIGTRRIRHLIDANPLEGNDAPRVSIIVAARNEALNIEAGLRSLLAQDYPHLEIVAINDRSSDGTGEIIDELACDDDHIEVIHVHELPPSWLGKNHALEMGAENATGDWLLFTDADVVMDQSVLRRAIRYAIENQIDHLAALPRITMPNWFLDAFVITFGVYFSAFFQPWRVKNTKSSCYVGIGAFNLIRADVYREIGTHKAIAMRPDDDVKLGKLVKNHGYSQEMLYAPRLMRVPWYASFREVVVGLEKNAFSGVDYKVWMIVLSSAIALIMHVWPFVAVFVTSGVTQWLNVAIVACLLVLCLDAAVHYRYRWWCAFAFPLTVLVFVFIQWRAMLLTIRNDGISWRDTHYPLAELKENEV